MDNRAEYQREWKRKWRAENKERARLEQQAAYAARKEREAVDPTLKEQREENARTWRYANLEHIAERAKMHYQRIKATPDGQAKLREQNRKARVKYFGEPRNIPKIRARWRASRALRDGRLTRQPCEVCGSLRTEMHHDDYSRPLDVRWLCKVHHEAVPT